MTCMRCETSWRMVTRFRTRFSRHIYERDLTARFKNGKCCLRQQVLLFGPVCSRFCVADCSITSPMLARYLVLLGLRAFHSPNSLSGLRTIKQGGFIYSVPCMCARIGHLLRFASFLCLVSSSRTTIPTSVSY